MSQQCIVEISLYPLNQDYSDIIAGFIRRLQQVSEFELSISTTSTQLKGPYAQVFETLGKEIQRVHSEVGQAILVCKFLAGDELKPGLYQGEL
jgi:uncharacterized protein YqgV (UPF0045/DUF77 family)